MNWHALIDPAVSGRLCLTLLHSLWQVAVLAMLVWCLDRCWRNRSVELRYIVHVGALVAALVALPVTYNMIDVGETSEAVSVAEAKPAEPVADTPTALPATVLEGAEVVDSPTVQPVVPVTRVAPQLPAPTNSESSSSSATSGESVPDWVRVAPWIIACYAAGVVLMLVRLLIAIIGAARQGAHAVRINEGPLIECLRSLAERWSMRVVPVLANGEQVLVPKLVGLVRPTILLPAAAVSGLSVDELELILAHELAHVRRRDMWINLLQRIAEAVLFFHPGLWYLTRRISTLREYCCDDMVCRLESDSSTEERLRYVSALLRVTELANPHLVSRTDLAALAADGRSPSELRRRVARLLGESVREPLQFSRGGWLTLLSVVTVSIAGPMLWSTYAEPGKENETVQNEDDQKEEDVPSEFQLTVVGPDGKPVPQAAVEIRSKPEPRAKQILRGEFVKKEGKYVLHAKADRQGKLSFARAGDLDWFEIIIEQTGFGPYLAEWDSSVGPAKIPGRFTAKLESGWSVGGIIVDETGNPVPGASVLAGFDIVNRADGTARGVWGGEDETNANGEWRYDHVPASQRDVHISVNHPDFAPLRQRVPRDGFGIKPGERPSARLMLKRGVTITGTVTDETGEPIEGAVLKTKFLNDYRETTTDKQGRYRLAGCEPIKTRLVAHAKGRALEVQDIRVEPDMQPVDFTLKPGGTIRVRVVDEKGKGIPKATIFVQEWRGEYRYFEFDHVNSYTDENGVWEWNEAPLDEFKADICRPGGMQLRERSLKAREEEYVFAPPKALVISGGVIDAKTKKPIKKFKVTPGLRNSDPEIRMSWARRDSFEATDGKYQISRNRDYPAHLVRIEADGYQMAISRDISPDEGEVNVDFELVPAEDIAAGIVTADGQPTAEAKVALGVAGSQISVENGAMDLGSTYATVLTADERGHFSVPARTEPFQIVITHPEGYAWLKSEEGPIPNQIKLTAWARVEGVFRVGKAAKPNVEIALYSNAMHSYGDDVPNIFTSYKVTTGKDGRFAFERVFPGEAGVGRNILLSVRDGAREVTSSIRVPVTLYSGKTTTLDLGGTGRPVVGQLSPPADFTEKVLWSFAMIYTELDLEPPPRPEPPQNVANDQNKRQAWWENWLKTPGGRAWQAAYNSYQQARRKAPFITATVDKNGAFRIDDVPAGEYELSVRFNEHSAGRLTDHKFTVPAVEDGGDAKPVDLGVLTLE